MVEERGRERSLHRETSELSKKPPGILKRRSRSRSRSKSRKAGKDYRYEDDAAGMEEGQEAMLIEDLQPKTPRAEEEGDEKKDNDPSEEDKDKESADVVKPHKSTRKVQQVLLVPTNGDLLMERYRQAARRAMKARTLLDQALNWNVTVNSRDKMATDAFTEAGKARLLVEPHKTPELIAMLSDAKMKGEEEAFRAADYMVTKLIPTVKVPTDAAPTAPTASSSSSSSTDDSSCTTNDFNKLSYYRGRDYYQDETTTLAMTRDPTMQCFQHMFHPHVSTFSGVYEYEEDDTADEHVFRAKQYLEFILPDLGEVGDDNSMDTKAARQPRSRSLLQGYEEAQGSMESSGLGDVSTLGYDESYTLDNISSQDTDDIFSMASLNAILDDEKVENFVPDKIKNISSMRRKKLTVRMSFGGSKSFHHGEDSTPANGNSIAPALSRAAREADKDNSAVLQAVIDNCAEKIEDASQADEKDSVVSQSGKAKKKKSEKKRISLGFTMKRAATVHHQQHEHSADDHSIIHGAGAFLSRFMTTKRRGDHASDDGVSDNLRMLAPVLSDLSDGQSKITMSDGQRKVSLIDEQSKTSSKKQEKEGSDEKDNGATNPGEYAVKQEVSVTPKSIIAEENEEIEGEAEKLSREDEAVVASTHGDLQVLPSTSMGSSNDGEDRYTVEMTIEDDDNTVEMTIEDDDNQAGIENGNSNVNLSVITPLSEDYEENLHDRYSPVASTDDTNDLLVESTDDTTDLETTPQLRMEPAAVQQHTVVEEPQTQFDNETDTLDKLAADTITDDPKENGSTVSCEASTSSKSRRRKDAKKRRSLIGLFHPHRKEDHDDKLTGHKTNAVLGEKALQPKASQARQSAPGSASSLKASVEKSKAHLIAHQKTPTKTKRVHPQKSVSNQKHKSKQVYPAQSKNHSNDEVEAKTQLLTKKSSLITALELSEDNVEIMAMEPFDMKRIASKVGNLLHSPLRNIPHKKAPLEDRGQEPNSKAGKQQNIKSPITATRTHKKKDTGISPLETKRGHQQNRKVGKQKNNEKERKPRSRAPRSEPGGTSKKKTEQVKKGQKEARSHKKEPPTAAPSIKAKKGEQATRWVNPLVFSRKPKEQPKEQTEKPIATPEEEHVLEKKTVEDILASTAKTPKAGNGTSGAPKAIIPSTFSPPCVTREKKLNACGSALSTADTFTLASNPLLPPQLRKQLEEQSQLSDADEFDVKDAAERSIIKSHAKALARRSLDPSCSKSENENHKLLDTGSTWTSAPGSRDNQLVVVGGSSPTGSLMTQQTHQTHRDPDGLNARSKDIREVLGMTRDGLCSAADPEEEIERSRSFLDRISEGTYRQHFDLPDP